MPAAGAAWPPTGLGQQPSMPGAPSGRGVALLAPLTGPNAERGQALVNAAHLALNDPGSPVLDVRDTAGTPQGAAAAATAALAAGARLFIGHGRGQVGPERGALGDGHGGDGDDRVFRGRFGNGFTGQEVFLKQIAGFIKLIRGPARFADRGIIVNYRHVIDSLVRKPKAFENYQHQACLFPSPVFRTAYDWLKEHDNKPSKTYLEILQLAKREGEDDVKLALELLLAETKVLSVNEVLSLIEKSRSSDIKGDVMPVSLDMYDTLHQFKGVA